MVANGNIYLMAGMGATSIGLAIFLMTRKGKNPARMRMSNHGRDILIDTEGYRDFVYDDIGGKLIYSYEESVGSPTIGIGHLINSDEDRERFRRFLGDGDRMTRKEVSALLAEDLPKYEKPAQEGLTVPVTQEMFDTLVHYAFNAGPNSTALWNAIDAANAGNMEEASEAIRSGKTRSGRTGQVLSGLVKRRNMEADWFLEGGAPTSVGNAAYILWGATALTAGLTTYLIYDAISEGYDLPPERTFAY